MKILQINKYHYLKGGADSVFFNTIELLKEQGHEVVPFCIRHDRNRSSEYESFFVDAPEIRDMKGLIGKLKSIPRFIINRVAARNIENLLKKEKFDVAHIHNIFNGISLSILPVLHKYGIPIVFTMHDTRFICPSSYFNLRGKRCIDCPKSFFLNCARYRCYQDSFLNSMMCTIEMCHKEYIFPYDKYISRYIFASNRFKSYHSKQHDYFDKKGIVLYNFLPSMSHVAINSKKGEYLFFYGRITVEKGVLTLIEAMKDLPDIRLKIAGTGPLLEKIREMSFPNIDLLGFLSGDALIEVVQNSSFVIVPSECEENNPLTIIEAYSYGKPVIGSRIGGIPEIIEEGVTGFTFDTFDKESLKGSIRKALKTTDSEYQVLSENARSFAEQQFHPDQHYHKLLSIYNQAISGNENL